MCQQCQKDDGGTGERKPVGLALLTHCSMPSGPHIQRLVEGNDAIHSAGIRLHDGEVQRVNRRRVQPRRNALCQFGRRKRNSRLETNGLGNSTSASGYPDGAPVVERTYGPLIGDTHTMSGVAALFLATVTKSEPGRSPMIVWTGEAR